MDEPRTGRSRRKLVLLLAVPAAAAVIWVSVAAAGGSGSQERARGDVAKPAKAKVQKRQAGYAVFSRGDRDCPFKDAEVTSADL